MPTIVREDGYEIRIYTKDHPPHVHVHKTGAEARFAVKSNTVTLLSQSGLKDAELAKAAQLVAKYYSQILIELGKMPWVKSKSLPSQESPSEKQPKKPKK